MADYWILFLAVALGIFLGVVGLAMVYLAVKVFRATEDARPNKRQTQSTDAGLLDTMADLNLVEFNLIEINGRINTIYQQVESAKKRAAIIRQGPYAYNKDQPSAEFMEDVE